MRCLGRTAAALVVLSKRAIRLLAAACSVALGFDEVGRNAAEHMRGTTGA